MPLPTAHRLLLLAALLAAATGTVDAAKRRKGECAPSIGVEHDPPYALHDANGERTGYHVELMERVLERMGCTPKFTDIPWGRALRELELGRLDLLPGGLRTAERESYAWYSSPIDQSPNLLFLTRKAARAHPLRRLSDLSDTPLRIAIGAGMFYGEEYASLLSTPAFVARLHPVPDRARAWRMLHSGRLDGIIDDQGAALVMGLDASHPRTDLVPVLVLSTSPSHVMMSRASVDGDFVRRFNEVMTAMRNDGSLERLRERWIPCDADPETLGCRTDVPVPQGAPPPPYGDASGGAGTTTRQPSVAGSVVQGT
jgi:polar amino acid transport system substrate-binding protein